MDSFNLLENLITVSLHEISNDQFPFPFALSLFFLCFFFQILDPLNPGKAMPLPLHLAEAGCVRWRPSGNSYLWSETCNLSNLLAQESKIGLFRSFVSYPSHPSSDPFRCCMSTRNIILPSYQKPRQQSAVGSEQKIHSPAESQERCIHHLTLSTPLAVRSFLPEEAKLIVDTGGMTHSAILSEVCEIYSLLYHIFEGLATTMAALLLMAKKTYPFIISRSKIYFIILILHMI